MQNGASPLYVASQEGHAEVVDMLLSSGADPNLATKVCTLLWCVHCPTSGGASGAQLLHVVCLSHSCG